MALLKDTLKVSNAITGNIPTFWQIPFSLGEAILEIREEKKIKSRIQTLEESLTTVSKTLDFFGTEYEQHTKQLQIFMEEIRKQVETDITTGQSRLDEQIKQAFEQLRTGDYKSIGLLKEFQQDHPIIIMQHLIEDGSVLKSIMSESQTAEQYAEDRINIMAAKDGRAVLYQLPWEQLQKRLRDAKLSPKEMEEILATEQAILIDRQIRTERPRIIIAQPSSRYIIPEAPGPKPEFAEATFKSSQIWGGLEASIRKALERMQLRGNSEARVSMPEITSAEPTWIYYPIDAKFKEDGDKDEVHNLQIGKTYEGVDAEVIRKAIAKARRTGKWDDKPLAGSKVLPLTKGIAKWYYPILRYPIEYELGIETKLIQIYENMAVDKPRINARITEKWNGKHRQKYNGMIELHEDGKFHGANVAMPSQLEMVLEGVEVEYEGTFMPGLVEPKPEYLKEKLSTAQEFLEAVCTVCVGPMAGIMIGLYAGASMKNGIPWLISYLSSGNQPFEPGAAGFICSLLGGFIGFPTGALVGRKIVRMRKYLKYTSKRKEYKAEYNSLKKAFDTASKVEIQCLINSGYEQQYTSRIGEKRELRWELPAHNHFSGE